MVRTVVWVDRRGKRPPRLECVCAADI
jgi:hypothetical protein